MSKNKYRWIEVVAHLIFWTGIAILFIQPVSQHQIIVEKTGETSQLISEGYIQWSIYAISASIFYLNTLIFHPFLFGKKRYWQHASALILVLAITILLERYYFQTRYQPLADKLSYTAITNHSIFVLFSLMYILVKHHLRVLRKAKEAEMAKISNELDFLKSQLNPHFLFNSINNIFSIAQKNEDNEVAGYIAGLSKTLRYSLYENNESEVSLSKEIEFLESYIQMSLLRYDEGQINFDYKKNILKNDVQIAPSLLNPLVENAFKHCSNNMPSIAIDIALEESELIMSVSNSYGEKVSTGLPLTGGIGLKNLKRRLELLYPDRYHFTVKEGDGIFKTNLKIQLDGV
ncbi:MAG: histidine kinase [Roseivirga sp.]|nr:histidine kinase [Roseivirga sp.]